MTQTLTGTGYVSYNGVTLTGPTVNTSFTMRPVRDDANRTVVGNIYVLTVNAIVTDDANGLGNNGTGADANIAALRAYLSKDGGELVVSGQGLGAFNVNTNSSNRDLKYGPHTVSLDCKQIGSTSAIEVTWIVEFQIAECESGTQVGVLGNFRAINYSVSYSIDKAGLTIRTISGYVEIILNRTVPQGVFIPYTADDVRDVINPSVPVYFQRMSQNYTISPDKARITFNIVDQELPSDNGYPQGVSYIDVQHSVKSSRNVGFPTLTNVISGTIEMTKPYPASLAIERAMLIIRERVIWARAQNNNSVLLHSVDFTESLFSRTIDFSVTYEILKSGLQQMLTDSGLYKPLDSTTYGDWANSMKDLAWHERGVARLKHTPQQDRIVDPCNQNPNTSLSDEVLPLESNGQPYKLTNVCPPKSRSYLSFTNNVSIEAEGGALVEHSQMSVEGTSGETSDNIVLYDESQFSTPPLNFLKGVIVQELRSANIYIVLRGSAMRLCYPSQFPDLKAIGGWYTPPGGEQGEADIRFYYMADESRTTHVMAGYVGGLKVYAATWELRYKPANYNANDLQNLIFNIENLSFGTQDDPSGDKAKEAPGTGFGP